MARASSETEPLAGDPLARLVGSEASVLVADAEASHEDVAMAVRDVAERGVARHGAFLVVEVWIGDAYRVHGPATPAPGTVEAFRDAMEGVDSWVRADAGPEADAAGGDRPGGGEPAEVRTGEDRQPPDRPPLLRVSDAHRMGALIIGLEVRPSWLDPETGDTYPLHLRRLAGKFSAALRQGVFEFLKVQAASELPSYRALGSRELDDAVWESDRRLAEISRSFDPLLLVAPVNVDAAWRRFRDSGFSQEPEFRYRLLPIDPDVLKRELYEVPLEEVQDPTAWRLLHEKREELDRQISLVAERNTPRFLHGSLRLFGPVDEELRSAAEGILDRVPPPSPDADDSDGGPIASIGADEFAGRAKAELATYRKQFSGFDTEVQVRPDLAGLMVSSGRLLIGSGVRLAPERVEPLLQHEVGTHVLTFVNGRAQPLAQLAHGLADYDELQEGLGVLAEYLVDGLTAARLRLLAARVVAVDARIRGASFLESFHALTEGHGLPAPSAYDVVARVHPGGGHTRDMIYLRGLIRVIAYLRAGGDLEPLYLGKMALEHVEPLRELVERGVLRAPRVLPAFLSDPDSVRRLEALREGLPLHGMVRGSAVA